MSKFSNIPPHAVLPLGAYAVDDLKRSATRTDQRLLYCDLKGAADKAHVLKSLAHALSLPKHFGHNLDALYDCLTDMKPDGNAAAPGFVVILENIPDTPRFDNEQRDALLDVFRDAADFFFDRQTAFRVFYSTAARATA